jgi:hypothetical protein
VLGTTLASSTSTPLGFDDIRFLIGQNSGLEYLVPIAITKLREDVFFEAEYFEGDLFKGLLCISEPQNFWSVHLKEKQELIELYENQKHRLGELEIPHEAKRDIKEAYKELLNK